MSLFTVGNDVGLAYDLVNHIIEEYGLDIENSEVVPLLEDVKARLQQAMDEIETLRVNEK
ncbi:hypothetical protein TAC_0128 [Acinetobacter phage TAC1]|nr:hypothetical protein TAC_0128 [Acinetobacter phage TAC1]